MKMKTNPHLLNSYLPMNVDDVILVAMGYLIDADALDGDKGNFAVWFYFMKMMIMVNWTVMRIIDSNKPIINTA